LKARGLGGKAKISIVMTHSSGWTSIH